MMEQSAAIANIGNRRAVARPTNANPVERSMILRSLSTRATLTHTPLDCILHDTIIKLYIRY